MFENSYRIGFPVENIDVAAKYNPVPYIAKTFKVRRGLVSATLNIFGYGEANYFLNGKLIPDAYRPTVPCTVMKAVVYNVYDLSGLLVEGYNRLGIMLSSNRCIQWHKNYQPSVILQLDLTYEDGSKEQIVSDDSFCGVESHIIFNWWTCGEIHDSRKQINNWCDPDFDDSNWKPVTILPDFGGSYRPANCPPIRKMSEKSGEEILPGLWDFHTTTSGYVRVKITGKRGSRIKINYAERLLPDTHLLDRSTFRKHIKPCPDMYNSDEYILDGTSNQIFDQEFAIHGFRYVEVVGEYEDIELTAVTCHTDMKEISSFVCDSPMLNKIHNACVHSLLTCLQTFYVDNPKRDAAWVGDQQLSAEMQAIGFDNYDVALENILMCVDAIQDDGVIPWVVPFPYGTAGSRFVGPDWGSVIFHVPYYVYRYTGKREIVDVAWDTMEKSMAFFATCGTGEGHILNHNGTGDWSAVNEGCRLECAMTTYYYIAAAMMAELAEATGRDSTHYRILASEIRSDYRKKYVKNGIVNAIHITEYILPAWSGILEEEEIPAAVESIVTIIRKEGLAFTFGVHGLRMIFDLLSANGHAQLIHDVLINDKVLGYAHTINLGYDTVPERFDWQNVGIYSVNHHFFGVVDTWFYKWLAGIRVEGFGMTNIRIEPTFVNGVDCVDANLRGIHVKYDCNTLEIQSPYPFTLFFKGREELLDAGSYSISR